MWVGKIVRAIARRRRAVNALVAHAAKVEDAILSTLQNPHPSRRFVALHQFGSNSG
jgi:hypothetical protein